MAAKYSRYGMARKIMKDPMFWGPMAAAGAGVVAGAAQDAIGKIRETRNKAHGYQEMLELHPHLKKDRNGKQVRRLYNSLSNINPTLARDPLVAGAWVDNVIESNQPYGDQSNQALLAAVKDLAGIRKDLGSARKSERDMRTNYGDVARRMTEEGFNRFERARDRHGTIASQKAQLNKMREAGQTQVALNQAYERRLKPHDITAAQREATQRRKKQQLFKKSSSEGGKLLAALR